MRLTIWVAVFAEAPSRLLPHWPKSMLALMRLKIENGSAEQNPATAPLFIINLLSGRGLDNLFSTHPSTENRIAALERLAQQMANARSELAVGPWGSS